jgi:ribosomal protein L37AE/L43A
VGSSTRKNLHVLCYQHHQEMPPKLPSESTEPLLYVCPEPACPIRYESSRGYFIDIEDKKAVEEEILPRVSCPSDERPMYLAKVHARRRSFRLWKCPECGATRTNEGSSDELGKKMGA